MFDILVYLYETYYRPDACPDSAALVKKLSAVGFEEDEMSKALGAPVAIADLLVQSTALGLNPAMTRSNYAVWRKFNGVVGRVVPVAKVQAAAAAQAAAAVEAERRETERRETERRATEAASAAV